MRKVAYLSVVMVVSGIRPIRVKMGQRAKM